MKYGTVFGVLLLFAASLPAAENSEIFQDRLAPLLQAHCATCHTGAEPQSNLLSSSYDSLLKGGKHGPAIVPGSAEQSLLMQYVNGDKQPRMPLGGALPAGVVEQLARALDEMSPLAETASGDEYLEWLLQKPVAPAVPELGEGAPVNPVDAFIRARLRAEGLSPAPPADRRALLRRVYFDLIGLPPSPAEAQAFLDDPAPGAYERLVDRLLADPRYGERWGRHWLDLVRYAESDGFAIDTERPTAWRYRDYVIRSFNQDKAYDRFIQEQLAGDELDPDEKVEPSERLVALGFLRMGPWEADANSKRQLRLNVLNELTATTGEVFLGLTVGCAQCHNHKYDPIPQRDFYRLQAFFAPMRVEDRPAPFTDAEYDRKMKRLRREHEDELDRASEEFDMRREALIRRFMESKNAAEDDEKVTEFKRELGVKNAFFRERDDPIFREQVWRAYLAAKDEKERLEELSRRYQPVAISASDLVPPDVSDLPETHVLAGGELDSELEKVDPGFLECISGAGSAKIPFVGGSSGRRRALAEWIASPDNPLTARVMVNRLWQHHFGQGLLRTPSDVGRNGDRPSHPELLDWLAVEFVKRGWSIKAMHRLMLTSQTYQQSTGHPEWRQYAEVDPDNRLLSRMNWTRLEAEVLRDTVLALSGRLNPEQGGPGSLFDVPPDVAEGFEFFKWFASPPEQQRRRSVYTFQRRSVLQPFLETFDVANMSESCSRRNTTNVAPQALTLLNGKLVNTEARHFARRIVESAGAEPRKQIEQAFWLALSRPPSEGEASDAGELLAQSSPLEGLTRLGVVLFNLNEFLYLE